MKRVLFLLVCFEFLLVTPGALGLGVDVVDPREGVRPRRNVPRRWVRSEVFRHRYDRQHALQVGGGSDKTEWAVLLGLRWLKQNQNGDGSWGEEPIQTAMTGLALLAFLGHGEDHLSIEFGAAVRQGISWLVGRQDEKGYFSQEAHWAYQHAIATYAMAEAYGMTGLEELRPVVAKAVWRICDGQTDEGGWYYGYAKKKDDGTPLRGGDTSVSGWQIEALTAAWYTRIRFSNNMLRDARLLAAEDIKSRFSEEHGCGYTGTAPSRDKDSNYCTTAAGTLCLLSLGQRDSDEVKAGLRLMSKYSCDWQKTTGGAFGPLYGWYYVTQAMFHAAPDPKKNEYWKFWNPLFSTMLISQQHADGHWDFPKSKGGQRAKRHFPGKNGHVYSTAMCCLMLETYYRYPPHFGAVAKPVEQPIVEEVGGEETGDEDTGNGDEEELEEFDPGIDDDLGIDDADLGLDEDEELGLNSFAGGSDKTQWAILQALRWLKDNQNEDGSWGEEPYEPMMTGLALLCLLGYGEDYRSEEFGATVRSGLGWLVGQQDDDGFFAKGEQRAYQHGIATYAMAETYAMTGLHDLRPVVAKAVRRICDGQTDEGGWYENYAKKNEDGTPLRGGDTCVSGWQIQALTAAWYAGIRFPDKVLRDARKRAAKDMKSRFDSGSGFGDKGTAPRRTKEKNYCTTAIGARSLQLLGHGESEEVRAAVEIMRTYTCDWQETEAGLPGPLYGWYYVTQAMYHAARPLKSSKYWKHWNPLFSETVYDHLEKDGHWEFPESEGGKREKAQFEGQNQVLYSTTLCCLMLEVYYRYLPTYRPLAEEGEQEPNEDDLLWRGSLSADGLRHRFIVTVDGDKLEVNWRALSRERFVEKVSNLSKIGEMVRVYVHWTDEAKHDDIILLVTGLMKAGVVVTVVPPGDWDEPGPFDVENEWGDEESELEEEAPGDVF